VPKTHLFNTSTVKTHLFNTSTVKTHLFTPVPSR
jgi:hypothetical protein